MRRIIWALAAVLLTLPACDTVGPVAQPGSKPATSHHAPATTIPHKSQTALTPQQQDSRRPASKATPIPELPASPRGGPGRFPPTAAGPLTGKVVVIDPGHNGGNVTAPAIINRPVWNGRETEPCDTTGTQTANGYTEARFNWNLARYLTADLRGEGATVVLTRTSNTGVGPCITQRAAIGNHAHANAAISIHADGGPPGGRGFTILEPVADGINNAIIKPSTRLGDDIRAAFAAGTREPVSTYDGIHGIQPRDNLAGLNLSTIPKVFIECANMRNPTDATLTTSPHWQAKAAEAIATGLTRFLTTH
jgi:N-acetylmuramoyl-L-alanine amidase